MILGVALVAMTIGGAVSANWISPALLPTGSTAGFDEAKFKTLTQESGRTFKKHKKCRAYLDAKLMQLLVAPNGTLYKDVKITEWAGSGGVATRKFDYAGHTNACGAPPPPDNPNYVCRVPAPDTFRCNGKTLDYIRAPAPPMARPM